MEKIPKTVPAISEKIESLLNTLHHISDPKECAEMVNDILIYKHNIPLSLISSSWDYLWKIKEGVAA